MPTRRGFIATALAAAALPRPTWADAGNPAWLGAAREPDGAFALFGIGQDGADLFRIPLPDRGHAAAAHPVAPEAVAFARRPGTFALVIDCARGTLVRRLEAPQGRHLCGHGAFIMGGTVLATPENEIETGEGTLGLWSREDGYARIGEVPTGGTGPHELRRMPDGGLVVANGGIRTEGREKTNIDTMRPNLAYLTEGGELIETVELDPDLHRNSIRHLAVRDDGLVAFAMQWQGDVADPVPLLGLHRRGQTPRLASADLAEQMAMQGYAGSIAWGGDGATVGITSPRGGRLHRFAPDGAFLGAERRADICGLAPMPGGYLASDGLGALTCMTGGGIRRLAARDRSWDNHLVAIDGT